VFQDILAKWRRLLPLLQEGLPPLFNVFAVVIGAMLLGYILPHDALGSRPIRIAGWILQTLGITTVALGISTRRRLFNQPSLLVRMWRTVTATPQNVQLTGVVGMLRMGGAVAVVDVSGQAKQTLEERLAALEKSADSLRQQIVDATKAMNNAVAAVRHDLQAEAKSFRDSTAGVRQLIQDLQAGGIYIDTVGVLLLLVGVLFTSLPDEIAAGIRLLVDQTVSALMHRSA
jgi:hypothetical protein